MFRWLRLHHVSAFLLLLFFGGAVAGGSWLYLENKSGFVGQWGEHLQEELEKRGIHADFQQIHLSWKGHLIVSGLQIYSDESREQFIAEISKLTVHIDRTSALRGEIIIRDIWLAGGVFPLPKKTDFGELSDVEAKIIFDEHGNLQAEEVSGRIGELEISLDANLLELDDFNFSNEGEDEASRQARLKVYALIHEELALWSNLADEVPTLKVALSGSLSGFQKMNVRIRLAAKKLQRKDYQLSNLKLEGELFSSSFLVHELRFEDGIGQVKADGQYLFEEEKALFSFISNAHIGRLIEKGLGLKKLSNIELIDAPHISGRGEYQGFGANPFTLKLLGTVKSGQFRMRGEPYKSFTGDFSWKDGDLYLRKMNLRHKTGQLVGNISLKGEHLYYDINSTLSLRLASPYLRRGGFLSRMLNNTTFTPRSQMHFRTKGWKNRKDKTKWASEGRAVVQDCLYKNVPLVRAETNFALNREKGQFLNPKIQFDYCKERLRKKYGGTNTAVITADKINYQDKKGTIAITDLRGIAWIPPLLRMFVKNIADKIEKNYRFQSPPAFSMAGEIDIRKPYTKTDFTTRIRGRAPMGYTFLGRELSIENTEVDLRIRNKKVDANNLNGKLLGGKISGNVQTRFQQGKPILRGDIMWTGLSLSQLGKTYGFPEIERGQLTGHFEFAGRKNDIGSLNGVGNIALTDAEIFKAPILGPLSSILSFVLREKKVGYEQAKSASATYQVKEGILYTKDFATQTSSIVITGEGKVDLATTALDLTIRVNSRGLLGLFTFPLRMGPLKGLYQFQGTGPFGNPKWVHAPFTIPLKGRKDPLFQTNPKARIIQE